MKYHCRRMPVCCLRRLFNSQQVEWCAWNEMCTQTLFVHCLPTSTLSACMFVCVCFIFNQTQSLQNNLFVLVLLIYLIPPWETRYIQIPTCINTHNFCTHSTHPPSDSYTLCTKSCWSHSHKSCINPYSHLT